MPSDDSLMAKGLREMPVDLLARIADEWIEREMIDRVRQMQRDRRRARYAD